MKNPNGYGGVIKLPGRRRKPYLARVTEGWEEVVATKGPRKGQKIIRQKFRNLGTRATKREAWALLEQHNANPIPLRADMTLQELYDEWSAVKFPQVSKSMEDGYEAAWKRLARFANEKVRDIRTAHFQEIIDDTFKKGLSASSLQKIRTLAVQLMDKAVAEDIVNKNYAKFIIMPKLKKTKRGRFTDLEVAKLWKNLHVPWVDTILIMIYSGMRPGEMLGLTKFNIDWDLQVITGAGIKTEAGKERVIPIHPKIVPLLRQWYNRDGRALICDEQGNPIRLRRYRETMYRTALETVGIQQLNPHCCRHTFASMMAEAEIDPVFIQQIIGHASYEVTAETYTHLAVKKLAEAIQKI